MTDAEIHELRERLAAVAQDYAQRPGIITDEAVRLDEDRAHETVTTAEILVFGLDQDLIPALQIAHMAYEELIDIIWPPHFGERTHALIVRAREIVPPIRSFGHEVPFETGGTEPQSFRWFAKTFLDLPHRQAAAIYAKHDWNMDHRAVYPDEKQA